MFCRKVSTAYTKNQQERFWLKYPSFDLKLLSRHILQASKHILRIQINGLLLYIEDFCSPQRITRFDQANESFQGRSDMLLVSSVIAV